MKGHTVTSEIQTELSVQVVLPNEEFKALPVLVDFGCQAVALANPNNFGDQISEKYESPNGGAYSEPIMRRLCRGGTSKKTSKFNLQGLWIVVFHFLGFPNMVCPRTLSRI